MEEMDRVSNSDYKLKEGQHFMFGNNHLVEVNELVEEMPVTQTLPPLENCPRPVNKKKKPHVESLSGDEIVDIRDLDKPLHSLRPNSEENDKLDLFFEKTINETEDSYIKSEKKETSFRTKRSLLVSGKANLCKESGNQSLIDLKNLHSFTEIKFSLSAKIQLPELPLKFESKHKYVEAFITSVANDFIRKVKKQMRLIARELSNKDPLHKVLQIKTLSKIPLMSLEKESTHYYFLKLTGAKVNSIINDVWALIDADNSYEAVRKLASHQDSILCLTHSVIDDSIKVSNISDKAIIHSGYAINILNASEYFQRVQTLIDFNKEEKNELMNSLLHMNDIDPSLRADPLLQGLEREDLLDRAEVYCKKKDLSEEQGEVIYQCAKWFVKPLASNHPTILISGGFGCGN